MEKAVNKEKRTFVGNIATVHNFLNLDSARFERKFYISSLTKHEICALVRLNSVMFKEVFYERTVNNIYLDSYSLHNYRENVIGSQSRLKVRIRWYGETFGLAEKPTLELKIKEGLVGWKDSYRLKSFLIESGFDYCTIIDLIKSSDIPDRLKLFVGLLEPALLNSYQRKYYLSTDGKFRITIDTDMSFTKIGIFNNCFVNRSQNYTDTILELKYEPEYDSMAHEITRFFPFRITKSSKYVSGIDTLK
ncbi:MAG: VTC domain-containing protein [candidate division Zixibacteria bacterium]